MQTPIYDFVQNYQRSGTLRLHMPGHKGMPFLGCEPLDITEIQGADALYEAEGIIAESERNAAALFGTARTLYSTEGSSQCIRAMLYLALLGYGPKAGVRPRILAARNVHKSFIHACALLDLDVVWLMPDQASHSLCSCPITPSQVAHALESERPFALYLTAPDYLGGGPDLAAIAQVCRQSHIPLLVDNAHGAYLKFLSPSRHPIDLGAAMCCDSAHKTLPVLTGGAYLHLSRETEHRVGAMAKQAMALFGSTSPSYLTLQSLDLCNHYLSDGYPQRLAEFVTGIRDVKQHLSRAGWRIIPSDPLKLVFSGCGRGYSGAEAAALLRQAGIECEFTDLDTVVLMLTPENSTPALGKLIWWSRLELPSRPPIREHFLPLLPTPVRRMSIREAVFSPHETISTPQALGRVCAAPAVSCPPAIPVAVSGEQIDQAMVDTFLSYGIQEVSVVRKEAAGP